MKRQEESYSWENWTRNGLISLRRCQWINVRLWTCHWNAVSILETRHHMKYSIILPVMKSLSWLPHVALTWLSGTIYGFLSPFDTPPEEMSKNVLIIPKDLRPQQNIWRLFFQFFWQLFLSSLFFPTFFFFFNSGMMLKLKLQCFGHLMRRVDSLEKTDAERDWG